MSAGSVTLDKVDDKTLAIAFEFKAHHDGMFQFNPQQMSPVNLNPPDMPQKLGYNGMTFTWDNPQGLSKVIELLQRIENHQVGSAQ